MFFGRRNFASFRVRTINSLTVPNKDFMTTKYFGLFSFNDKNEYLNKDFGRNSILNSLSVTKKSFAFWYFRL